MNKVIILVAFLSLSAVTDAELVRCDPARVEWFPHPHDCESYIICFHGVEHILPCAPGLHFSPTELRCTFPEEAQCHVNYMCPPVDDDNNPVMLPDPYDCGVYYLCSRGTPIRRECAPGLWWDAELRWCNVWDDVTCDNRTVINPDNPGNRTTLAPTTTLPTTSPLTTTPLLTTTPPLTTTPITTTIPSTTTLRPGIESCHMRQDLFDGNTYLKSMCIVNANVNYETARQRCVSLNMNLFIIDDSRVQVPFFNATTFLLRGHLGGFVWINGRRFNQEWFVHNADNSTRGLLYNGVSWVNTTTINGPTNGDCLRYSSQFGPYAAMGIACTSTSWLICEHGMRTEDPPTTTPIVPTTTPSSLPDIGACRFRRDLFDGQTYLKSMCIISTSANYENSRQGCSNRRMNLFIIDNSIVQTEFFNATTDLLRGSPGGFVWINGRRINTQWYVFNADNSTRGQLYSGVSWVNTSTVHGPTNGDCLRYSSQFGPYQAMGIACTSNSWYICEYSMQSEDPPTTTPMLTTTTETPILQPNLTACWRRSDLYHNGTYLKSSCIINTSHNYESAERTCRANRMELFVIDSAETQMQFRNSTRQLLVAQPRGFVWINGRVDDDCGNWYVFNPVRSLMFLGVHWVQTDSVNGRYSGPCLRYTQQFTDDYLAMGVACTSSSWIICEYSLRSIA